MEKEKKEKVLEVKECVGRKQERREGGCRWYNIINKLHKY